MPDFKHFTRADLDKSLSVSVEAFYEDHSYKTTYADDPELIKCFDAATDKDPLWGWCCVRVRVTHVPTYLYADAFLGECSYEDAEDFTENSDYYDQMVEEAIQELNNNIENLLKKLPYYHDQDTAS